MRVCRRALQGCKANQAYTDPRPTKSEYDSSNAKPNHTSTHIHLFLKEKIKINRKEEENDTLRRTY